jgi:Protein of unknown function (DUF3716)
LEECEKAPISGNAKSLAGEDRVRIPELREGRSTQTMNITRTQNQDAILGQSRGEVVEQACDECVGGFGLFTECVTATAKGKAVGKGACMNCLYGSEAKRCNFHVGKYNLLLYTTVIRTNSLQTTTNSLRQRAVSLILRLIQTEHPRLHPRRRKSGPVAAAVRQSSRPSKRRLLRHRSSLRAYRAGPRP